MDSRVGEKPLFRVGEAVYTWDDVVARARETGDWQVFEADVRAGLAALRQAGEPDADDVEEAARAFRYARGLLAGDELDAWLDARGLTTGAWEAYLRRSLARELSPEPEGVEDVAPAEVAAGAWSEGICSGVLEGLASELATLVAVAPDAAPDARDDEYDAFCAAAATDAAITREIESNRLEWVRVRYDVVAFPDEDSARRGCALRPLRRRPARERGGAHRGRCRGAARLDGRGRCRAGVTVSRGRGGQSRRPRG